MNEPVVILAALLVITIPLLIPIIAMLLKHQRTMAEIIHRRGEDHGRLSQDLEELREEIKALRTELQYRRLFDSPDITHSEDRR